MERQEMFLAKNIKKGGNYISFQLRDVPVQYANAIRRVLLNETPCVVISNIQILENTTLMPHEVMKHRVSMLPVNVVPLQEDMIRDTNITIRMTAEENRVVTSDDFTGGVLMKDADLGTPMFFMKLKKGESIHITGKLSVDSMGSQVCLASYGYHVDEEKAKLQEEEYEDKLTFQNFYKQKSFHTNERGLPDWFDFEVESIGIVPAKECVKTACKILKANMSSWAKFAKENILREREAGVFSITSPDGHTIGALAQIIGYEICQFISYDVPHPLKHEMKLRFRTDKTPEEIIEYIEKKTAEYCDATISGIDK